MTSRRKKRKEKRVLEEKNYKNFSKVFYFKKKVGETPLELLEKFKKTLRYKY
jgi:hypothetical protein